MVYNTKRKNEKKTEKNKCIEEMTIVEWYKIENEVWTDFKLTEIPENTEIKTRFPFPFLSMGCQNYGISDVIV